MNMCAYCWVILNSLQFVFTMTRSTWPQTSDGEWLHLRTPMDEMRNKTFVLIAQLAGDKEDRDNKLRRMSDELKKLKDNLARQERMEDEVCFNIPKTGLWMENVISMPLARIYWIVTVKEDRTETFNVLPRKIFSRFCFYMESTPTFWVLERIVKQPVSIRSSLTERNNWWEVIEER